MREYQADVLSRFFFILVRNQDSTLFNETPRHIIGLEAATMNLFHLQIIQYVLNRIKTHIIIL